MGIKTFDMRGQFIFPLVVVSLLVTLLTHILLQVRTKVRGERETFCHYNDTYSHQHCTKESLKRGLSPRF